MIMFLWDGEAMVPLKRFRTQCDREFTVGDTYTMEPQEVRSAASHKAYFAAVREGWKNLPEEMSDQFPTDEHLRKYALIKAGYADCRSITCGSRAEALRVAGFVRPMDAFAIVSTKGPVVHVWTSQSQSFRAMGREKFEASKRAVLDMISSLIGVSSGTLVGNAGAAA